MATFKVKIPANVVVKLKTRTYEEALAIGKEMSNTLEGTVALFTEDDCDDGNDASYLGALTPNFDESIWVGGEDD